MKSIQKPLISIIVPVYQVAPYLGACLDSVIRQSYTHWEMLLVDDGSTDGGAAICDAYALADARIRVFHQENAGLSAARNTGLDNMRGDYVTFIDSDDVLLTGDYLEILLNKLTENQAQISMCDLVQFSSDDELPRISTKTCSVTVTSGKEVFRRGHIVRGNFHYDAAYMKLYQRSCFERVRFPVGKYVEYLAISHLIVYPCERVVIVDAKLYGYRTRDKSILHTHNIKDKIFTDTLEAFSQQYKFFKERGDKDASSRVMRRIAYARGAYFVYFAAFGGGETLSPNIMPEAADLISFPDRRWVYNTLGKSPKESARVAKEHFMSLEVQRASCILSLVSSLLFHHSLPEWNMIKPHVLPILDMAMEEGLAFIICEALKQCSGIPAHDREKCEQYQNTAISKALRFRGEIFRAAQEPGNPEVDFALERRKVLDSLYPAVWYRFPGDIRRAVSAEDLLDGIAIARKNHDDTDSLYCSREGRFAKCLIGEFNELLCGAGKASLGDVLDLALLMQSDRETRAGLLSIINEPLRNTTETLLSLCDKMAQGRMMEENLTPDEQQLILCILKKGCA